MNQMTLGMYALRAVTCALFFASAATSMAEADEHTCGLWLFDEVLYKNGTALDASRSYSDLRYGPGAKQGAGRFGSAIRFDLNGNGPNLLPANDSQNLNEYTFSGDTTKQKRSIPPRVLEALKGPTW